MRTCTTRRTVKGENDDGLRLDNRGIGGKRSVEDVIVLSLGSHIWFSR